MTLIFGLIFCTFANEIENRARVADTIAYLVRMQPPYTVDNLAYVIEHLDDPDPNGVASAIVPAARNQLAQIVRANPLILDLYMQNRKLPTSQVADLILISQQDLPELAAALKKHEALDGEGINLAFKRSYLDGERANLAVALTKQGIHDPAIEDVLITELEEMRVSPVRLNLVLENLAPAGIRSDRAVAALAEILTPPYRFLGRLNERRAFHHAVVRALGEIPTDASTRTLRSLEEGDEPEDIKTLAREARLNMKHGSVFAQLAQSCGDAVLKPFQK